MQIDWITTAAQLVNFFVLVWLLRRFLFHPIVSAIAARRAEIAHMVASAEAEQRAADREREGLVAERAELAASLAERRAEAEAQAAAHRAALRADAEDAAATARAELADALDDERRAAIATLRAEAGLAAVDIARSVLGDLADEALESLVVRRLGRELAAKDPRLRDGADGPIPVTLTCRWPKLSGSQSVRERICRELSRVLGSPVTLELVADAEAPVGAVLEAPGMRASWTLDDHLDRIAERLAERFAERQAVDDGAAVVP